jgi:hypothetical protein
MNFEALLGPAVVAAIVSGFVAVVGLILNLRTTRAMHREKLDFDREQTERKVQADIALAEKKLDLERTREDWKRRSELAEQILTDFYKARHVFTNVRAAFARPGEGASRPRTPGYGETEDQARHRDAIYAPMERLSKERDFLSELNARRFRFAALFGTDAEPAFNTIVSVHNQIAYATELLLLHRPGEAVDDSTRDLRRVIVGGQREDEIKAEIDRAVALAEKVCRPVLDFSPR